MNWIIAGDQYSIETPSKTVGPFSRGETLGMLECIEKYKCVTATTTSGYVISIFASAERHEYYYRIFDYQASQFTHTKYVSEAEFESFMALGLALASESEKI